MSISASNGLMAVVMSNSSAVGIEKVGRNARRPHFSGCGLLENVAEFSCSALSSDKAQPILVAGATTESGAAGGPVQVHGACSYSETAAIVKDAGLERRPQLARPRQVRRDTDARVYSGRPHCPRVPIWSTSMLSVGRFRPAPSRRPC